MRTNPEGECKGHSLSLKLKIPCKVASPYALKLINGAPKYSCNKK